MTEEEVTFMIRTADKTKKGEFTLPRSSTVTDIIEASKNNWSLPKDAEYRLVNVTKRKQLLPRDMLSEDKVSNKDELELLSFLSVC
jgi:hypothetical protein